MKLYAIRYGEHFKYGLKGAVFKDAENPNERIDDFAFCYYLAEYNGKYILFDTGFRDEQLAKEMGVTLLPVADDIQKVFGKMPEIDMVVITHSHWDHINNLDLYPGANIVIARLEYDIALAGGTAAVKECLSAKTNKLVDDSLLIEDKFLFEVIGGHTSGSSVVYFEEAGKQYVITGDECYLRENAMNHRTIGICADGEKNGEFIRKVYEKCMIPLPFHDASILKLYNRLSDNIVQIV